MPDHIACHVVFPARQVLEENDYNVFPPDLEADELVFFHATAAEDVESILRSGLQPGIKLGRELTTISFADKSAWALHHWVTVRNGRDGVILALQFDNRDELSYQSGTYYSRELKSQPRVIAMCPVPSTYKHI